MTLDSSETGDKTSLAVFNLKNAQSLFLFKKINQLQPVVAPLHFKPWRTWNKTVNTLLCSRTQCFCCLPCESFCHPPSSILRSLGGSLMSRLEIAGLVTHRLCLPFSFPVHAGIGPCEAEWRRLFLRAAFVPFILTKFRYLSNYRSCLWCLNLIR